jgi:hypothetical protein
MRHHRPLARVLAPACLALAGGAGCASFQAAPQPLYPGPPRPAAELAVVNGPLAAIDALDVSRLGPAFYVLPGCHAVVLREHLGEGSSGGAWSVTIPRTLYAIDMVAGHSYEMNVHLLSGNSASIGNANVGGVKITAVERDASGKVLRPLAPLGKGAEGTGCVKTPARGAQAAPESEPPAGAP